MGDNPERSPGSELADLWAVESLAIDCHHIDIPVEWLLQYPLGR